MTASRRDVLFKAPFAVLTLVVLTFTVVALITSPPDSWVFVAAVVAGVIICGSLQIPLGRNDGLPFAGVAIAMLAIPPVEDAPYVGAGIWAAGFVLSQALLRRDLLHALYSTGAVVIGAFAFVAIQVAFAGLGVWSIFGFLLGVAAHYFVAIFIELLRQMTRPEIDRGFSLASLSPGRLILLVIGVAAVAVLMTITDAVIIPWLEHDASANFTPFVVLLAAFGFYGIAQRMHHEGIERRLRAVVEAAVELPQETSDELTAALLRRTRSVVQANEVEIRKRAPENAEIGSRVTIADGTDQYLIARRKIGGLPFSREDESALATLAHMASEAARTQQEVDELERRANSDPLTGLPNYGAFQEALVEANENRSYHEGIALLFLDIDNFKALNDTLGHSAGDELLKTVAERLLVAAGGGDFVARVGGDEFVVVLRGLDSPEQAKETADRIVAKLCKPLFLMGDEMRPVFSAGVAFSSHRELNEQTLVEDADQTMLRVKRSRRQGVATSSSVMLSSHRSTRTNDIIARAIRENRLSLAFQPIVDIERNEIWAFEVLVRYLDPELGPISPPSLVARAKSLGLLNELTKQVVTKALDAAEEIRAQEPNIDCITVNFEVGQVSDAELGPFIREVAGAHPEVSLCVELNERSLRTATDELRRDTEALQAAGITIALDDYGSDESSVGALVHFPMDILKIDRSLISSLGDARQREVIKSLQGFGDNLGYVMIVEGIETPAMLNVLVELGVRNAQGYYFGKPMPFSMTMERLRKHGARAIID